MVVLWPSMTAPRFTSEDGKIVKRAGHQYGWKKLRTSSHGYQKAQGQSDEVKVRELTWVKRAIVTPFIPL